MSVKVMSQVWEASGLGATDKLILLALADHADDAGVCYPSVKRLCARCGLSERAVQTAIKRLQGSGWLTIRQNAGPRGCNVFCVHPPRRICTPAEYAPPQEMREPPQMVRPTPAAYAPEPSRTINKPSNISLKADAQLEEAYSQLMAVFPKRHAPHPRKQTLKSLKTALKADKLENILTGAKAYAAQIRAEGNEGKTFVKMASTWLNNDGWKDFAQEPAKPSGPNWPLRAETWAETGNWSDMWGPPPDSPDFAPPENFRHLFKIRETT